MSPITLRHKYKDSNTFNRELLDELLKEDLWLLNYTKQLNGEMLNELAFYSGVTFQYLKDLMEDHNKKARMLKTMQERINDVQASNKTKTEPKN